MERSINPMTGIVIDSSLAKYYFVAASTNTTYPDGIAIPTATGQRNVLGISQEAQSTQYGAARYQPRIPGARSWLYVDGNSVNINPGDLLIPKSNARGIKAVQNATVTTTEGAGVNAKITFTAKEIGSGGNQITVQLRDPAGNNQSESVTQTGDGFVVNLATGPGGAITSTPTTIKATIEADASAAEALTVTLPGSGATVVTAQIVQLNGAGDVESAVCVARQAASTDAKLILVEFI